MKTITHEDVFEDGEWKKCLVLIKGQLYAHTRAYTVWKSINRRCDKDNQFMVDYPSYEGTENRFESFQEFAEWANSKYGYMHKEKNGNYWSIDKDISGIGHYCKEGCLFVPNYINASILDSKRIRGDLPLGVAYRKRNKDMKSELKNCYLSNVKNSGKRVYCGYHETPESAHRAWQEKKLEILKEYLSREEVLDHKELKFHMERIIDWLQSDYDNYLVTEDLLCQR